MRVKIKTENGVKLLSKCFLAAFITLHKVREVKTDTNLLNFIKVVISSTIMIFFFKPAK